MNHISTQPWKKSKIDPRGGAAPTHDDPRFDAPKWTYYEHGARLSLNVARRDLGDGVTMLFTPRLRGIHVVGSDIDSLLVELHSVLETSMQVFRERGVRVPIVEDETEDGDVVFTSVEVNA